MSSAIRLGTNFIYVSNVRLVALLEFALEVADQRCNAQTTEYIGRLRRFLAHDWWNGCDFDLAERFATVPERKFWAECFAEVARRIFQRSVGDQDKTAWQPNAIGEAFVIARLLTRSVQETELGWHPKTASDQEPDVEDALELKV